MYRMSNNPTYRLRVGDTLLSVARRHGFKITDLTALNPNINPHMQRPGATVKLPSLRAAAPAPAKAVPIPVVVAAPVEVASVAEEPAPVEVASIAEEPAPVEVASIAEEPAPVEVASIAEEPAPVEVASIAGEPAPTLLVGNFLPGVGHAHIDPLAI